LARIILSVDVVVGVYEVFGLKAQQRVYVVLAERFLVCQLRLRVELLVRELVALHHSARSAVVRELVPQHVLGAVKVVVGYFLAQLQVVPDVVGELYGAECLGECVHIR
jgi:hypothetical protein